MMGRFCLKTLLTLFIALVVIETAGATTIPFEIGTNGFLDEQVSSGFILGKQETIGSGPFFLSPGESIQTTFFKVWIPLSYAKGIVTANIELLTPNSENEVADTGDFEVWSLFGFLSGGTLNWGDPIEIPYSYGGRSGGFATLDLFDINIPIQKGTYFEIKGSVTNVRNPVPEASTAAWFIVLGTLGIVGGIKQRKRNHS